MGNIEMPETSVPNTHHTSKKVARFLVDSVRKDGAARQISVSKIALLLGMTPCDVNESLVWLQERDVIQLQRGRIIVRNM